MKAKGRIYLLIGYLGSGKTTFIRNLLANKQNQKYAVIQNQFTNDGEMGIEMPLIMDESGVPFSNFLELPNGCICCSAKNDLIAGIEYILNNTDVRNIVVETNGLADPGEAIKQFWFDDKLQMNAQLHSIITIISVPRYALLQKQNLFHKQVAFANKILLTFIDKSTLEQVQEVESAVLMQNSECVIAKNMEYDVVGFLAGNSMFDLESMIQQISKQQHQNEKDHTQAKCEHKYEGHNGCTHHGHRKQKSMHEGITSHTLRNKANSKTKSEFECSVGELLWESDMKILRIKGIVCLDDNQNAYELQGVDDLFELKPTKTTKQKVNNQTVILVIGENIEINKLQQILKLQ